MIRARKIDTLPDKVIDLKSLSGKISCCILIIPDQLYGIKTIRKPKFYKAVTLKNLAVT